MDLVEIDAGGVLIVQIERERGVVKLRAHAVGAAEGAGELHLRMISAGRTSPVS